MDRGKAIGLALMIAGVAGGIMYYLYTKKAKETPVTPPVVPPTTPPTGLGRAQVRNVAERFSMPIQSSGIAGRTNMGAVQMTSLVSGGASNAPSGTPSSSGGGRYDVFTSPQATSNLR